MGERRWSFTVHDARGTRHRGLVTYTDITPRDVSAPEPPVRFHIIVLAHSADVPSPPPRVAICSPGLPRLHAVRDERLPAFPRRIVDLTLPRERMTAYAAGTVAMAAEGLVDPGDVFPVHSDRPRLDRLALALVEAAGAEAAAPYKAVIRHELGLPPVADALSALDQRLSPPDRAERPPVRAPSVVRLRRALRALRLGDVPAATLDELTEDLRFIRLFDADAPVLEPAALHRLLDDVRGPATPARGRRGPAPVVPLRPPEDV